MVSEVVLVEKLDKVCQMLMGKVRLPESDVMWLELVQVCGQVGGKLRSEVNKCICLVVIDLQWLLFFEDIFI